MIVGAGVSYSLYFNGISLSAISVGNIIITKSVKMTVLIIG